MLGLSQQQTADRLAVKPSALSNWEHGARAISLDINTLDALLDAGGVLAGLLWAHGSTKGLDPAPTWSHAFPGQSTPVWMWIRSPGDRIEIAAEWGVFAMEASTEPTDVNGLFVTLGASVDESPVTVQLNGPGWVDFGRGELPEEIPGARVLPALDLMTRSSANGRFMNLFVSNMAGKLAGSDRAKRSMLTDRARRGVASFLSGFAQTPATEVSDTWTSLPNGNEDELDRLRFGRLRRSRGLSLANVTELLAERADVHVGKETLRRFEIDVGHPHDRMLPAALDEVLGANGYLAVTTLRSGHGNGSVGFPPFWLGPVWVELDGPSREVLILLQWGDWSRRLRVSAPALFTFTCSVPESPIRITALDNLRWTVGVGRRPGATSIDHNWDPSSVDNAQRALSTTEAAFLRALRVKKPD